MLYHMEGRPIWNRSNTFKSLLSIKEQTAIKDSPFNLFCLVMMLVMMLGFAVIK